MMSDPGSTSPSLISRAQGHDGDAWTRLCAIYGPLIYAWLRQAGFCDTDAADIGQDVFMTVAIKLTSFDPHRSDGTFRGWLRGITRHKAHDHRRRQTRRRETLGLDEQSEVGYVAAKSVEDGVGRASTWTDADLDQALVFRVLRSLQGEFSATTWQAFWRTVVDGQDGPTAAKALGLTSQAVRQARYRVLVRLRQELRDEQIG